MQIIPKALLKAKKLIEKHGTAEEIKEFNHYFESPVNHKEQSLTQVFNEDVMATLRKVRTLAADDADDDTNYFRPSRILVKAIEEEKTIIKSSLLIFILGQLVGELSQIKKNKEQNKTLVDVLDKLNKEDDDKNLKN